MSFEACSVGAGVGSVSCSGGVEMTELCGVGSSAVGVGRAVSPQAESSSAKNKNVKKDLIFIVWILPAKNPPSCWKGFVDKKRDFRANQITLEPKIVRVDRGTVVAQLEMEMRSGGIACRTHKANYLTTVNDVAAANIQTAIHQMRIER